MILNGRAHDLADDGSALDAVVAVGADGEPRGVAVAVDGAVVPRSAWATTPLREGSRIEVLRATAGG